MSDTNGVQQAELDAQQFLADLAHSNSASVKPKFDEIGTTGLDVFSGIISKAYLTKLQWPSVQPIYDRIYRADSEVTIQRIMMANAAGDQTLKVEIPAEVENPTQGDKDARDFYEQALIDMDINRFWIKNTSTTPFYGFGWWSIVPGLRRHDWHPPDRTDDWRSQFDDGLVGIRRLAWRDHSSFKQWEIDDDSGRMTGFVQHDFPNPEATLPLSDPARGSSVHMTFGDEDNPEGLATLEAMYRLERVKFALEVVQGLGFEHAAGYLKFNQMENTGTPSAGDIAALNAAARAVMSAQQNNFLLVPFGYEGDIMDVPFAAAGDILTAIKYYSVLKLALLNMQFVAIATFSGVGSQAALKDSTTMWLSSFNSMQKGFAKQLDRQVGRYLFDHNRDAFSDMTMRPRIVAPKVQKLVELGALGQFVTDLQQAGVPIGEDDIIEIRRKSDFLPETLPIPEEEMKPKEDSTEEAFEDEPQDDDEQPDDDSEEAEELTSLGGFRLIAAAKRHPEIIELQGVSGLFRAAALYETQLTNAVVSTLQLGTPASTQAQTHRNLIRAHAFSAFLEGMRAAGSADPFADLTEDDQVTIDSWISSQTSFIGAFAARSEEVGRMDDDNPLRAAGVAEINGRIHLWVDAMISLAGLGKLSILGNVPLTFLGPDGAESCPECQQWKNKRHRRSFWEKKGLLGRGGNNNFTCGRWVCNHSFFDDNGTLVVL